MATFNTRLKLKYDTYANWMANDPVLMRGEVAFVEVPAKDTDNGIQQAPVIMQKVGNGTSKFSELEFTGGYAVNVYDWALAASKPEYTATEIKGLEEFIGGVDENTTYQIVKVNDYEYKIQSKEVGGEWVDGTSIIIPKYDDTEVKADITALEGLVGTTKVADQISSAITALDLGNTYETKTDAGLKLADAKDYTDAQIEKVLEGTVAQATADAAGNVITETYETKADASQKLVDAKAYTDALANGAVKANTDAIDAIEADYLKAADKTELEGKITEANNAVAAEKERAEGVEAELLEQIEANAAAIEVLTDGIDADKVDGVKDLIKYVEDHGPEVTGMKDDIAANTAAIEAEAKRADAAEKANAALIAANTAAIEANDAEILALDGRLATAEGEIDALQADSHTHANAEVLDGISAAKVSAWDAKVDTVTTVEGAGLKAVRTGNDVVISIDEAVTFIFDCGDSFNIPAVEA